MLLRRVKDEGKSMPLGWPTQKKEGERGMDLLLFRSVSTALGGSSACSPHASDLAVRLMGKKVPADFSDHHLTGVPYESS